MAPLEAKECTGRGIIELSVIVTLDNFDCAAKLRENKGEKLTMWEECQI
jgi:hypothetical protein